jgi:hypothetical protein
MLDFIAKRDDGDQNAVPWARHDLLPILLPACLTAYTVLYDIAISTTFPWWISRPYRRLTSPFRNFIHLEDLEEATPDVLKHKSAPPWKSRSLIALSFVQVLVSLIRLFYNEFSGNLDHYLGHILPVLCWVRIPHLCFHASSKTNIHSRHMRFSESGRNDLPPLFTSYSSSIFRVWYFLSPTLALTLSTDTEEPTSLLSGWLKRACHWDSFSLLERYR